MDAILPNQPESNVKLFQRSLVLFRRSFAKVFIFALLVSVIFFTPRLISMQLGYDFFWDKSLFSFHRLWLLGLDIVAMIFFISILWHVHCVSRNVSEPLLEDLQMGLKKVFYVFIAALIQTICITIIAFFVYMFLKFLYANHLIFWNSNLNIVFTSAIFVMTFIVILYFSTLFYFFTPLIATENKGILNAISKSASLVWNHLWRIISLQITPWIVYCLALVILDTLLNVNIHLYFSLSPYQPTYGGLLLNIIFFACFIPWFASVIYIQLKDLELRKSLVLK